MSDKNSNLKLLANDEKDLKIFSAYLQDAVIITQDIKFLLKNKTLACIFNRFMWEDSEKGVFRDNRRVRSALIFKNVTKVKSKNINVKNKSRILEFLAIESRILKNDNYSLKLIFSGGGVISMEVEFIDSTLEDFSESWPTKYTPKHKI
jgi:hypothetical protein